MSFLFTAGFSPYQLHKTRCKSQTLQAALLVAMKERYS